MTPFLNPICRSVFTLITLFCVGAAAQTANGPVSATNLADQKFNESASRVETLKKAAEDLKAQLTRTETLLKQNSDQTTLALQDSAITAPVETLYRLMDLDQGCDITPIDGKPGEYFIQQITREGTTRIRFKFAASTAAKRPTLKRTQPENMPTAVYEYEQPEWMQDNTSGVYFSALVKTVKTTDSTSQEIEQVVMAVYHGETQETRAFGGFLQGDLPKVTPVTCRAPGQM